MSIVTHPNQGSDSRAPEPLDRRVHLAALRLDDVEELLRGPRVLGGFGVRVDRLEVEVSRFDLVPREGPRSIRVRPRGQQLEERLEPINGQLPT